MGSDIMEYNNAYNGNREQALISHAEDIGENWYYLRWIGGDIGIQPDEPIPDEIIADIADSLAYIADGLVFLPEDAQSGVSALLDEDGTPITDRPETVRWYEVTTGHDAIVGLPGGAPLAILI